ncbi:hypothetical protein ACX0HA_03145 [Flavobacterium hauense]
MNEFLLTLKKYLSLHRDKFYLHMTILFFVVWIAFKGPFRWFLKSDNESAKYFLGVAPNFFAAITLMFWITYATSSKITASVIFVMAILITGEVIQNFIPTQTVDVADIYASLAGCGIAAIIIRLRLKQVPNIKND